MRRYRIIFRVDEELYNMLRDLSEFADTTLSDTVRYYIVFARAIHDPSLTYERALKDVYRDMLFKDPVNFIKLPIIDTIKPLHELLKVVREVA